MWKMIVFLWLIPLALGIVALTRMAAGTAPMKRQEWRVFFGKSKQTTLSLWKVLEFAVLALGFFIVGVIQGIILPNLGTFWFLAGPLLTGGGTVLLSAVWLRLGSSRYRVRQSTSHPRGRIAEMFFR